MPDKAGDSQSQAKRQDIEERILGWDLSDIEYLLLMGTRYLSGHDITAVARWTDEQVDEALKEYRRFMILVAAYPDVPLVPLSPQLIETWSVHTTTTSHDWDYEQGVGHLPALHPAILSALDPEILAGARAETACLYREYFGEEFSESKEL